jgi:hypothetical protein
MKTRADDFDHSALPVLTRDTAPNPARIRRDTLPLDGTWTLQVNGGASQPVQVPFAPQAKINGIAIPDGRVELTYARTFELPLDWPGALLHLEGVDHDCDLWVNGAWVARHRGAWDPVGVFVPESVLRLGIQSDRTALHSVRVVARDHSHARTILSGKQEREPREGAIFYGNMSGLWKSVWIEKAAETRLGDFQVVAEASGRLCVTVEVLGAVDGHEVALELSHEDGGGIALRGEVVEGRVTLIGRVEDVLAWSTDTPHLYFGTLSLHDAQGALVDEVQTYAGFRDFVMRDGYYRLNGKPFYLQGLLNQAIYPDTLYTPTDDHTLTDYEHTLDQGFNGERRHQTTPRSWAKATARTPSRNGSASCAPMPGTTPPSSSFAPATRIGASSSTPSTASAPPPRTARPSSTSSPRPPRKQPLRGCPTRPTTAGAWSRTASGARSPTGSTATG